MSGFAATCGGFGPVVGGSTYAGPRAVLVHFAAGASDLAAATAMVAAEGGAPWSYVVDLATAVSQNVALPAAMRMFVAGSVDGADLRDGGGVLLTPNVDVGGYQWDIGAARATAGDTGTIAVDLTLTPGQAASGHVAVVIACHT